MEADPQAQAVGREVERRWHCSGDGLGQRVCWGGLARPGEALWGVVLHGFGADEGVHHTVSTAVFAAAASGVPSELRVTCMGKSGV